MGIYVQEKITIKKFARTGMALSSWTLRRPSCAALTRAACCGDKPAKGVKILEGIGRKYI